MAKALFRQAMRALLTTGLVVAVVSVLVVLPAFTLIGGLLTLFLLATAYPIFLLGSYLFAGWHAARHLGAAAAPLPRWRAALALGGGGALTLTLTAALSGLTSGVVFSCFMGIVISGGTGPRTLQSVAESVGTFLFFSASILGLYLLAGLIIGTLCAWGTAYWRLGRALSVDLFAREEAVVPPLAPPRCRSGQQS